MRWSFTKLSIAEFAAFEQSQGQRVIKSGDIYWSRVRPGFYRPLLPFREYPPGPVRAPRSSLFGAHQYAVAQRESANSFLNLLIFENPQSYSLQNLDRHERREIRRASEVFNVLPVRDVEEFKQKAYPVYLSFYERTRYQYKPERREKRFFSLWSDLLYRNPNTIVLGAYKRDQQLGAIGVWHMVEDTLTYTTFFSETESLKMHVTGLMLHAMQEAVVGNNEVKQIFVGMHKHGGRSSVDDFYLARGCTLLRKPAFLHLNPLAKLFLVACMPKRHRQLRGQFDGEEPFGSPFGRDAKSGDDSNSNGTRKAASGAPAGRLRTVF